MALILSLCVFAFVAREARAVEPPQEKPQQQRSAEKPKPAKSGAEATSTAGTTSAEARPAETFPAEPPPDNAEPTPEAPPAPEPVAFEPAPEAAPLAPEPVYEPVAFEPAPEAAPPAPVPATLAAEPAAFEPAALEPALQSEPASGYDAAAPVDIYPAEDPGFVPAQGLGPESEEQYPATVDERIPEPVDGVAPAGTPVVEKPLAGAPPVEPALAGGPLKPAPAPDLSEKDKPAPARTGETLKLISPVPGKLAPDRSGEISAPKPVVPARRREEPRPVPAGPTAVVKTLQNTANALGRLADGALFRPVTVEVDWGSTGAALAGLFSGAQAALTPADDYAGNPEPPSGGTDAPSGDGTSQRSHAPFTLPPLGSSSFSLLPGGGELGPGSAGSLLLLGVLASGLVLLRWNGRLYRAWYEPPRLDSLFLQALERPG